MRPKAAKADDDKESLPKKVRVKKKFSSADKVQIYSSGEPPNNQMFLQLE